MPEVPPASKAELTALDAKINALLPPQYQSCYDTVRPDSMGSAGLVFGRDGKVAWDEIWTSFCELALAGGPSHRGTLLEPVTADAVRAARAKYQAVVEEIGRGIWLTTELPVSLHVAPGWVGVQCASVAMASWLTRAIIVENVSVRHDRQFLHLPAGPDFRLEKEIKNVVTALAKTNHYWAYHMPESGWAKAASTLGELLEPALPADTAAAAAVYQQVVEEIEQGVRAATPLALVSSKCAGWVGVQCTGVEMAVWLLRAVIVENIMVRREGSILFLPANPKYVGPKNGKVVDTFAQAWRLWELHASA